MRALAYVERFGVPIDTALLARLKSNWGELNRRLVVEVDAEFGCYDGTTFKHTNFETLIQRAGLMQ